jgi:hypothetical protein
MIVTDGQDDPAQSTRFERQQEVFSAPGALPVGHFHAEDLAASLPINSDGHQDRPGADDSVLAHLLIPRVEDQVGILAVQFPTGKAPKFFVELLVESTDRACAKTVPAKLLAGRFDLSGRYSLDVHGPLQEL